MQHLRIRLLAGRLGFRGLGARLGGCIPNVRPYTVGKKASSEAPAGDDLALNRSGANCRLATIPAALPDDPISTDCVEKVGGLSGVRNSTPLRLAVGEQGGVDTQALMPDPAPK